MNEQTNIFVTLFWAIIFGVFLALLYNVAGKQSVDLVPLLLSNVVAIVFSKMTLKKHFKILPSLVGVIMSDMCIWMIECVIKTL